MSGGRNLVRNSAIVFCVLTASLAKAADSPPATPTPALNELNQALLASWKQSNLQPTPAIDDLTFLRRVWLDLAGRIPPLQETQRVLGTAPQVSVKPLTPLDRAALVDRLLASDEFANHWGREWTEYLTDQRPFEAENHNGRVLQKYLRDALHKNEPYDAMVRELIVGQGTSDVSGPANFLLRYNASPAPLTGAIAEKFLGITLKCAECHDHPHTTWKQADFWGLAAYFGRLRRMTPTEGDQFSLVIERSRGELEIPDMTAKQNENGEYPKKIVYPRIPGAPAIDTTRDRRDAFLVWLTSRNNRYFSRTAVNRVWEMLLGRPLTRGLDPLKESAPAQLSDRAILDALANDFVKNNFDLHRLIRTIVLSEAYQRSAGVPGEATNDESATRTQIEHFARYPVRPLSADQLHLSLLSATGSFGDQRDAQLAQATGEEYSYDIAVATFSNPAMTPRRSLALLNGERAREAVSLASESAIRQFGPSPGVEHIHWLFLSILSREPQVEERDRLLELIGTSAGEVGIQDAAWVLINSAEFNSNH